MDIQMALQLQLYDSRLTCYRHHADHSGHSLNGTHGCTLLSYDVTVSNYLLLCQSDNQNLKLDY